MCNSQLNITRGSEHGDLHRMFSVLSSEPMSKNFKLQLQVRFQQIRKFNFEYVKGTVMLSALQEVTGSIL